MCVDLLYLQSYTISHRAARAMEGNKPNHTDALHAAFFRCLLHKGQLSTLNWIPCTRTPAARERLALFDGDWDRDQRSLQLRAGLADHQAGAAAHGGEDEVAAHHGRLAVVISLAWLRRL